MEGMPSETIQYIKDALQKQGILTPNVLAYALATAKAEAGGLPKREIGGPQQAAKLGYSGGTNYYGRGYIQLTHDYNYRDIGKKIGVDLVNNPDLALDPKIAANVLAVFFKDRGIAAKAEKGDFVGARRGVNPDARGQEIAGMAKNYLKNVGSVLGTNYSNLNNAPDVKVGQVAKYNKQSQQWELFDAKTNKLLNAPRTVTPTPKQGGLKGFFKNILGSASLDLVPNAYAGGINSYRPPPQPTYTVRPGDTLSGIAQQYLGNPNLYNQISGYSSGNPNLIQPGEKLSWKLPQKFQPKPSAPQPSAPQPSVPAPSAQLSWKPPQQNKIQNYLAQNPVKINNAPIPKPQTATKQPSILPKGSLTTGWGTGTAIRNAPF